MAVDFTTKERYGMQDLLEIMRLLRSEHGCPWDLEQTHQSIRKNFIEETYEVCEAIDTEDTALLKEELGDVLLQVVFHTQMEQERGMFDFEDVCTGICQKLVERHPHIFGNVQADNSAEVLRNWDAIKRVEKKQETYTQTLEGVSKALPALMRSTKVQHRAARAGFTYPNAAAALRDLRSEVEELEQAVASGEEACCKDELGDVLFSAVNVARKLGCDAEEALDASCGKFIRRVATAEELATEQGQDLSTLSAEQLDVLWKQAKRQEQV